MFQAALDDVRLFAEPLTRGAEFQARLLQITAAEVSHLHPLHVAPDALFGVQLRRVAGEALQVDACRRPVAEELLDLLGFRWIGAPSQTIKSLPGMWRSRCLRKRITSALRMASS